MLKTLCRAFFCQISHSFSNLPYNANWQLQRVHQFADFFSKHPLIVCDVGARGADVSELENLKRFVDFIGFEADPEEAERLHKHGTRGYRRYEILPYFVGASNELQDFHLFKDRELSSSFAPNPAFQRDFGTDGCCIEKTIRVESHVLDQVFAERQRQLPDVVKLDTQGTELGILSGSPQVLAHALLAEVEVEFYSIYENQPLFYELGQFTHERGFELLYLNRVFASRRAYDGESRGQLLFGDALFGKSLAEACQMPASQVAKYVILLLNYGHVDFAHQLVIECPAVRNSCQTLTLVFVPIAVSAHGHVALRSCSLTSCSHWGCTCVGQINSAATPTEAGPSANRVMSLTSPMQHEHAVSLEGLHHPITAIVLTKNEQSNIGDCLRSLDWVDDVLVLDSFSSDETVDRARQTRADVRVLCNEFQDFGAQRNWALDHGSPRHAWILFLDADERCTPELADAIRRAIAAPGKHVGYYLCCRNLFLGKWIRRSTLFPSWQLRLLRAGEVQFAKMGHGQIEVTDEPLGYIREPYDHHLFSGGVTQWIDRHNRYSSAEAAVLTEAVGERIRFRELFQPDAVRRRRALKRVLGRLGLRPLIMFVYLYVWRAGFLDGRPGLLFCLLRAAHELHIVAKQAEARTCPRKEANTA